jgi:hypothetical protein
VALFTIPSAVEHMSCGHAGVFLLIQYVSCVAELAVMGTLAPKAKERAPH